jgi:hypothetical protein
MLNADRWPQASIWLALLVFSCSINHVWKGIFSPSVKNEMANIQYGMSALEQFLFLTGKE